MEARWTCPGYKTGEEVIFKHQTRFVVGKSKAISLPKRRRGLLADDLHKSSLSEAQIENNFQFLSTLDLKPLAPGILDQAAPFFICNYVAQSTGKPGLEYRGNHEYLPILHSTDSPSGPPSTIITALGLASLSNKRQEPSMMLDARRTYVKAMQLVTNALQDPVELKSDHTLAAVMLLGLFEVGD